MQTGMKAQQAMFLENLWKEMDKVSSSSDKNNLAKTASRYASEGYEDGEIVELLVSDGFDKYMAHACVEKLAGGSQCDETNESEGQLWKFAAEDNQGDVVSNHDLECEGVRAPNETIAWEKAQDFLDASCSRPYTVTEVSPT